MEPAGADSQEGVSRRVGVSTPLHLDTTMRLIQNSGFSKEGAEVVTTRFQKVHYVLASGSGPNFSIGIVEGILLHAKSLFFKTAEFFLLSSLGAEAYHSCC